MALTVGLFLSTPEGGVQLLGRTQDPELADLVRDKLLAERRAEYEVLEGGDGGERLRLVPLPEDDSDG